MNDKSMIDMKLSDFKTVKSKTFNSIKLSRNIFSHILQLFQLLVHFVYFQHDSFVSFSSMEIRLIESNMSIN